MDAPTSKIILFILLALAVFACFLNAIVLMSASTDSDTVMNLNWSYGESGGTTVYTGIYNYVVHSDGGSSSSTSSQDYSECNADWCEDCNDSMKATIAFAVFSFIFTIPSIITNFLRTTESGNTANNQIIGAITAGLAIFAAILTVIIFGAGCQQKIEDETSGLSWDYGVCFGMMITVIVLELINIVGNMLIPARGTVTVVTTGNTA